MSASSISPRFGNRETRFNASGVYLTVLLLLLIAPFLFADSNEYVKDTKVLNPLESAGNRIGNFLGSIVGALIGLLLFFIVGPYLLFKSEFQNMAQHFSAAKPANPSAPATGYVYLSGKAELKEKNVCAMVPGKQCLYYSYKKEKLVEKERVVCGSEANASNVTKISPAPDKCRTQIVRENGQDVQKTICEKCWNAKVAEWETVDQKKSTPEFKIGVNTVTPFTNTKYMGDIATKDTQSSKGDGQYREHVDYIESTDSDMLVVGSANNGMVASGDPFVISNRNFEATKALIVQEQKNTELLYKILGFIAFLGGMYLILSPIPALIDIAGAIPFIGGIFSGLAGLAGGLLFVASIGIAIAMTVLLTIVFKILRAVTDNIVIVIIVAILIGGAIFFVLGGMKPPV